jgi:crotonobetainyl-CoA:carnitine CoA-transferase CaiB-like acyl-CoA transferase
MQKGLAGIRVLEFSDQIAGPYCSKLFIDGGAEVIKVESQEGDSMRRWSATGADLRGDDSALFSFLNAGKQSVVGAATDPHIEALLREADLVIFAHGLESDTGARLDAAGLRAAHPSLVVLSITPYGLAGPWADRRATEFTLQAESGSIGVRGLMGKEPIQAGGRISEWAAGAFGAVAALPAVFHAHTTGQGELIDLSILEVANTVFTNFSESMNRLMNGSPESPEHAFVTQSVETPSIEPTADGYVGFCTNARQQFSDFLLLIERPDLREDEQLAQFAGRLMRFDEWNEIMRSFLLNKTTAEVIELASLLRIPVAPICNGATVQSHEQLKARGVFGPDAEGRFVRPRRPYRIDDVDPPAAHPAPRLGAHTQSAAFASRREALPADNPPKADEALASPGSPTSPANFGNTSADSLPLAGLRVLDLTAWWAGPAATHMLANFGAEVIRVESAKRPDGLRMIGGMLAAHYDDWWETSAHFLHVNTNKLDITLDLSKAKGRELVEQLITQCDAIVENFSPRVLGNFGLSWERVQELNPDALMLRMPAFGLSGPWRDNTGFAQTMEQLSGLAWVTGHPEDQPRIPRGPCDPVAGMHAAVAFLVALAERSATGHGHHVESTMVESALNVAAEQVIEWSAYGNLVQRDGNRSPLAAPQGLYPCAGGQPGAEKWLALSIATDSQWRALCRALADPNTGKPKACRAGRGALPSDNPPNTGRGALPSDNPPNAGRGAVPADNPHEWAKDSLLATRAGRRAAHDAIDERLREWTRLRERTTLVNDLRALGIPASEVADPCRLLETNPQFQARNYFETPEHPVVGAMPLPSLPFRYASIDRWLRTPAPTIGQHNEAVLCGILGLSPDELRELEAEGVIGTRPEGL